VRRWEKFAIAAVLIIIGGTMIWWQMSQDESLVRLDGRSYHVSIMRTDAQLEKGLSGTTNLPSGDAMLFVFSSDSDWQMWMKDMNYPIDMVWLNDAQQVVYTVKNAQPSSYDKANPSKSTLFQSRSPAHYVIELPSGTIERTGIKNGDQASLPSGV
jgi:uncharacterized membrane protein (UPF0127 family)